MQFLKFSLLTVLVCSTAIAVYAQGNLSGSLEASGNFYQRDSTIGASNTPQYDNQLSGADAWLNLSYRNWGFDIGVRFDLFNNSNLRNPQDSYSAQGLGMWYISKSIQKLDITVGHIYDQIGSGIIFRAYEERPLSIDNALVGLRLNYNINENWSARVMTGRQRNFFTTYQPIIKSLAIDGFVPLDTLGNIQIAPGFGVVNRTLDDQSMNLVVANINTYDSLDAFVPMYNTYAFSLYNTLTYKNFSWYVEGAYKTHEAIANPNTGLLIDKSGSVFYTSLSYAGDGLGITVQAKRTENFTLRTSPNETLLLGVINFLPPMARQNTYRLTSRYNAATQEFGELAFQADVLYSPKRNLNFLVNFSNITDLDGALLYREVYTEATIRKPRKWKIITGIQFQQYNQEVYEQKPGVPLVQTIIPYFEYSHKFDRKKSLRTEIQYMHTEQDFGSWLYGLVEFNIAPNWSFAVTDMINVKPKKYDNVKHFYTFLASYSHKANIFSLSYVKQVEGIVCTGGVCRYEPAFNGVKARVVSSF